MHPFVIYDFSNIYIYIYIVFFGNICVSGLYNFIIICLTFALYFFLYEKDRPEIIADSHFSYGSVGMKF